MAREAPFVAHLRVSEAERVMVLLNLSGEAHGFDFGEHAAAGEIVLGTRMDRGGERLETMVEVRGDEGLIVRLR